MSSFGAAVVDGTNEFIDRQRGVAGECRVTLAMFDAQDPLDLIVEGIRLENVKPLQQSQYELCSGTPLYDAIGYLIELADRRVDTNRRQRRPPELHTVMIYSDGLENASTVYDRARIFAMLTERQREGWMFVFMGANQDSYEVGRSLGANQRAVRSIETTPDGFREASRSASGALRERRVVTPDASDQGRDDSVHGAREAKSALLRPSPRR